MLLSSHIKITPSRLIFSLMLQVERIVHSGESAPRREQQEAPLPKVGEMYPTNNSEKIYSCFFQFSVGYICNAIDIS